MIKLVNKKASLSLSDEDFVTLYMSLADEAERADNPADKKELMIIRDKIKKFIEEVIHENSNI